MAPLASSIAARNPVTGLASVLPATRQSQLPDATWQSRARHPVLSHTGRIIPSRGSNLLPHSAFHGIKLRNIIRVSSSDAQGSRFSASRGPVRFVRSLYVDEDDNGNFYIEDDDDGSGLIDAPVSIGDGFSFVGGKYAEGGGRAEEWEERGRVVAVAGGEGAAGGVQEVRDPVFGLRMGEGFQASSEGLRWFVIDTQADEPAPPSPSSSPPLLLLHGLPSHSYSFRQVINTINPGTFALTSSAAAAAGGGGSAEAGGLGSEEAIGVRCVAPDWLGFGGSDKPQADQKRFGYSPSDYARELGNLVATMGVEDVSVVAQGYFCLPAAEFVLSNPARIRHLIFINPPITDKHAKLPSCLSAFSNFLLGEIFAQDPLRASDRVLEEAGCYLIDEEDAMVYRRPYLASGASGFALTSITRAFQKDLKASLPLVSKALAAVSAQPSSSSTVIWGMKDRWQSFDGVRETCRASGAILVTLDEVGHHAQEDYGEEVGRVIRNILRRTT